MIEYSVSGNHIMKIVLFDNIQYYDSWTLHKLCFWLSYRVQR